MWGFSGEFVRKQLVLYGCVDELLRAHRLAVLLEQDLGSSQEFAHVSRESDPMHSSSRRVLVAELSVMEREISSSSLHLPRYAASAAMQEDRCTSTALKFDCEY